ncbi:hypothetical protein [Micromonospora sonchi]|nr:hypothetical protein [Micromonospora sonchi]
MDVLLAVLLVLVIGLLFAQTPSRRESARTAYRLAALERRLALVMQHLGVPDPDPLPVEVQEHLARGDKIQAIAAYRKATGVGLAEAKEAVEAAVRRGLHV